MEQNDGVKKKIGRPKKYTIKRLVQSGRWKETWKEEMYELGRQGKTRVHIMNYFDLSRRGFYQLLDDDMDFRDTVQKTMELSQEWWVNIAQKRWIEGTEKNINSQHWSLMMRNMFKEDWSEKQYIDHQTKGEKINNDISVRIIRPDGDKDDTDI